MADPKMQTFTGKLIDPLYIKSEEIDIRDIAHALATTNRYGGHSRFPFSVAQHSLLVAAVLPAELQLWGLLHDAGEAYLGDMIYPLKYHLTGFQALEHALLERIAHKYGLSCPMPSDVHEADLAIGATECKVFGIPTSQNRDSQAIEGLIIKEMPWEQVELKFLSKFNDFRGAS